MTIRSLYDSWFHEIRYLNIISLSNLLTKGAAGHNVAFIHPRSAVGVLVELVQAPDDVISHLLKKPDNWCDDRQHTYWIFKTEWSMIRIDGNCRLHLWWLLRNTMLNCLECVIRHLFKFILSRSWLCLSRVSTTREILFFFTWLALR